MVAIFSLLYLIIEKPFPSFGTAGHWHLAVNIVQNRIRAHEPTQLWNICLSLTLVKRKKLGRPLFDSFLIYFNGKLCELFAKTIVSTCVH